MDMRPVTSRRLLLDVSRVCSGTFSFMRPRVFIISAVVIGAGLVVVLYFNQRQPRYQGKSLDYWLSQLDVGPAQRSNATVALKAMGPKAVSHLLRMAEREPWQEKVQEFWHQIRAQSYSRSFFPDDPRRLGPVGLGLLGSDARTALPRLEAMHKAQSSPFNFAVEAALMRIRGDSPDNMISVLWTPEATNWHRALAVVQELGPEVAPAAVPPLISACGSTNFTKRWFALFTLGHIGWSSEPALQTLVVATTDPDFNISHLALGSLAKFPSDLAEERVVDCLQQSDPMMRGLAINALERRVPLLNTNRAISNLTLRLKDSDEWVRESASRLLKELRGQNK
jgi:hypothetical protein